MSETHLSVIEPEDFEAALWDLPDFDWAAPMFAPNVSLPAVVLPSDFLPLNTSTNASGVLLDSSDLASADFDLGLIDLGFRQQVADMKSQLDSFVDHLVGLQNTSKGWTFAAFVTLVPLRCAAVDKVASLFDQAMATTNPDAGVVSVAQRLGSAPCSRDGVCPCLDSRRRVHTSRVLELRSQSKSADVVYPLKEEFPYSVDIQKSLA